MSDTKTSQNTIDAIDPTEEIVTVLRQLTDGRAAGLSGLHDVQVASQVLMQREAKRLARKLGGQHPRVQKLLVQRAEILKTLPDLVDEAEVAAIRVPEPTAAEMFVQGRIFDEYGRSVDGLNVYLADQNGQRITSLGSVVTDATGYYALLFDPEKVPSDLRSTASVTVETESARVVYRAEPLPGLAAGLQVKKNVQLKLSDLVQMPPTVQPATEQTGLGEPQQPAGERWVVKGTLTDAKGNLLSGLMVSVFDKDRQYDDKLGSAISNKKGAYEVSCIKQDFQEGDETGPDLYVTVIDNSGTLLYTSRENIRFDAGQEELFDIQITSSELPSS